MMWGLGGMNLIEMLLLYSLKLRKDGREAAEASLVEMGCDDAVAAAIRVCFLDDGTALSGKGEVESYEVWF